MKNRALMTILFCASAAGGWIGALIFNAPAPRAYAGTAKKTIVTAKLVESTPKDIVDRANTCPAESAHQEALRTEISTTESSKTEQPKLEPKPVTAVAPPAPTAAPAAQPLRLRGRVISNMDVEIKCKVGGLIIGMPCDVGDTVRKGQLLVELDTSDEERATRRAQITLRSSETRLSQARESLSMAEKGLAVSRAKFQAQLKSSQVRADRARIHAERIRQTLKKNISSQEEYDDAEADAAVAAATLDVTRAHADELTTQEAGLELKRQDVKLAEAQVEMDKLSLTTAQERIEETKVFSPIEGVITGRYVQAGSVVASGMSMQGTRIMTVSDLSKMWAVIPVDLGHIGQVRCGRVLSLTSEAYPGQIFKGRVTRISPKGTSSPTGVTFEARIEILDDRVGRLKPEMPVDLTVAAANLGS